MVSTRTTAGLRFVQSVQPLRQSEGLPSSVPTSPRLAPEQYYVYVCIYVITYLFLHVCMIVCGCVYIYIYISICSYQVVNTRAAAEETH